MLELEARLGKYENLKNSDNSSIPPAKDPFEKQRAFVKKSNASLAARKDVKARN